MRTSSRRDSPMAIRNWCCVRCMRTVVICCSMFAGSPTRNWTMPRTRSAAFSRLKRRLRLAKQMTYYDLLLKGGHLIDPKQGIDAEMDIAFAGGKVAAVAPSISDASAADVRDVSGNYV